MKRDSERYLNRPTASSLAEVVDRILDKGLVLDVYVRASLLGIELVTLDARVVIASVDTYLRFAEAVNRLELEEKGTNIVDLPEDMTEAVAEGAVKGVVGATAEAVGELAEKIAPDKDR